LSVEKRGDVAIVTVFCKLCDATITVEVPLNLVENASHFPVEYAAIHGAPAHGLTLYFDRQFNLRGTEIIRNIQVAESDATTKLVPKKIASIPPMAVSLGMISKKEFKLLQQCDGKRSVLEISKKVGMPPAEVEEACRQLQSRKILKLDEK